MRPHSELTAYYPSSADRADFVDGLFDRSARHYETAQRVISLGSGLAYRRFALSRAGFRAGMGLLDVATGTGLCARAAASLGASSTEIVGLDRSFAMLRESRKFLSLQLVRGLAERLPLEDRRFDFLTMGYALRHVSDLGRAFREYYRVLKPGGKVLLLEITRPRSRAGQKLGKMYFGGLIPWLTRVGTGSPEVELMMRYYWDTIAQCVPPESILATLRAAGFIEVSRRVSMGLFSEYAGTRPD